MPLGLDKETHATPDINFSGFATLTVDEKGRFSIARVLGVNEALRNLNAPLTLRVFTVMWRNNVFVLYIPIGVIPRGSSEKHWINVKNISNIIEWTDVHMDKLHRIGIPVPMGKSLNLSGEIFVYGIGIGFIATNPENYQCLIKDNAELIEIFSPLLGQIGPEDESGIFTFELAPHQIGELLQTMRQLEIRSTTNDGNETATAELAGRVRKRIKVIIRIQTE